jgi:hypothetical protein
VMVAMCLNAVPLSQSLDTFLACAPWCTAYTRSDILDQHNRGAAAECPDLPPHERTRFLRQAWGSRAEGSA